MLLPRADEKGRHRACQIHGELCVSRLGAYRPLPLAMGIADLVPDRRQVVNDRLAIAQNRIPLKDQADSFGPPGRTTASPGSDLSGVNTIWTESLISLFSAPAQ
jgi:hypothetical protein